jgi:transposase-like protein
VETKANEAVEIIKCPGCGASDITFAIVGGRFHCHYCGRDSVPDTEGVLSLVSSMDDLKTLEGKQLSPGMGELRQSSEEVVSFRCPGCKAEMSVETKSDVGSLTCHWCRHTISVADKINNGARPDCLIPFEISKRQAEYLILDYLAKYRFYIDPIFAGSFRTDMIRPVYLPYVLGDFHLRAFHNGDAAIYLRKHTFMKEDPTYDYAVYNFERKFNLYVSNLLVEANRKYAQQKKQAVAADSRNIVNSMLPFDTTKLVDYDPKFLNGDYRAEFRDMSYDELKQNIKNQCEDIAVFNALKTMTDFTSGYQFKDTNVSTVGERLSSVLCPIWLYSYMDKKRRLHYICVNGQTGETAACVPLYRGKLFLTCVLMELAAIGVFFIYMTSCAW